MWQCVEARLERQTDQVVGLIEQGMGGGGVGRWGVVVLLYVLWQVGRKQRLLNPKLIVIWVQMQINPLNLFILPVIKLFCIFLLEGT